MAISMLAYRRLAFPTEEHDQIIVRALVLVHPGKAAKIDVLSAAEHSYRRLSIDRFEAERGGAEAPWRWLADQLQASATSIEARQPYFFMLGSG